MKTIRYLLQVLFLAAFFPNLFAQEATLVVNPPHHGTFFSAQRTNLPPLPINPFPELDVYSFGNAFIYDDRDVDYVALKEERLLMQSFSFSGPPQPGEGGGSGGSGVSSYQAFNFTNGLWFSSISLTPEGETNLVNLVAQGTFADVRYQLLSTTNLAETFSPLGSPIAAYDTTTQFFVESTNTQEFYRLMEVTNPLAPVITITSPTNGTVISNYDDVEIHATISMPGTNEIAQVVLWNNITNKVGTLITGNSTNVTFNVPARYLYKGAHNFQVFVRDDSEPDGDGVGNIGYSAPLNITVSNPVWFPNDAYSNPFGPSDWVSAGNQIFLKSRYQFDTPDLDLVYRLWLYDPQGNVVWDYPEWYANSNGGRLEHLIGFYDQNTNRVYPPDPYYTAVIRFRPGPPEWLTNQQFAASSEEDFPAWFTNIYYIEQDWPAVTNTEAIVTYMPMFTPATTGEELLDDSMVAIRDAYASAYSIPLGATPYKLSTSNHWETLYDNLSRPLSRNFFYCGHGSPTQIGAGKGLNRITGGDLFNILRNEAPVNGHRNLHPYRSAIIFGCNTGKKSGDLLEGFLGIRQDKNSGPASWFDFSSRGMEPRAGVGFDDYKAKNLVSPNYPVDDFFTGMERLVTRWAAKNDDDEYINTIEDSVNFARRFDAGGLNGSMLYMRIVGDKSLLFQ